MPQCFRSGASLRSATSPTPVPTLRPIHSIYQTFGISAELGVILFGLCTCLHRPLHLVVVSPRAVPAYDTWCADGSTCARRDTSPLILSRTWATGQQTGSLDPNSILRPSSLVRILRAARLSTTCCGRWSQVHSPTSGPDRLKTRPTTVIDASVLSGGHFRCDRTPAACASNTFATPGKMGNIRGPGGFVPRYLRQPPFSNAAKSVESILLAGKGIVIRNHRASAREKRD